MQPVFPHQHGGPVSALLAHVVEQVPTLVPMRCGRLTVDLMRAVPVARLETAARVVREGKRVQVVEAALVHDGVEVARASARRVRTADSADAHTQPRRPDESPLFFIYDQFLVTRIDGEFPFVGHILEGGQHHLGSGVDLAA